MTHIFQPHPREAAKWQQQAAEAAAHLKKAALDKPEIVIGFVFDDGIVKVTIAAADIRAKEEKELAQQIYNLVLTAAQVGGTA